VPRHPDSAFLGPSAVPAMPRSRLRAGGRRRSALDPQLRPSATASMAACRQRAGADLTAETTSDETDGSGSCCLRRHQTFGMYSVYSIPTCVPITRIRKSSRLRFRRHHRIGTSPQPRYSVISSSNPRSTSTLPSLNRVPYIQSLKRHIDLISIRPFRRQTCSHTPAPLPPLHSPEHALNTTTRSACDPRVAQAAGREQHPASSMGVPMCPTTADWPGRLLLGASAGQSRHHHCHRRRRGILCGRWSTAAACRAVPRGVFRRAPGPDHMIRSSLA